jgi:uncharacterized protein (DUF1015 family)
LVLRPFRALRYDRTRVGDLWDVTSPPYDVLDGETIAALLERSAYNVVRLILPRHAWEGLPLTPREPATGRAGPASAYGSVAALLSQWRSTGVLHPDDSRGLYVYEYAEQGVVIRGLVGCIGLYAPEERVVLPHEDVMPGPVLDRLELMGATRANLEPILLVYDGGGAASDIVEAAVASPPLVDAPAPDGTSHRIWQVSDVEQLATIAADLAPRQALIADGHHRYATYRRLQDQMAGTLAAPAAEVGLAMLVDQRRHPLALGAIARSAPEVDLGTVRSTAGLRVEPADSREDALRALGTGPAALGAGQPAGSVPAFAVTDGAEWLLVYRLGATAPRPAADDIEWLHASLLPGWGVADEHLGYHHDVDSAVRAARSVGGIAVATREATVDDVLSVAAAGRRMPRKSTSFGPKPRMGLLLRTLAEP